MENRFQTQLTRRPRAMPSRRRNSCKHEQVAAVLRKQTRIRAVPLDKRATMEMIVFETLPNRRDVLATSGAVGAATLLSEPVTWAADGVAVRPFHFAFRKRPRRSAPAHRGDAVAREGDGHRSIAGRAARDDAEARALLGDRLRLAQVRGEAQRRCRTSSPRSTGSTFISFTCARSMKMRCR